MLRNRKYFFAAALIGAALGIVAGAQNFTFGDPRFVATLAGPPPSAPPPGVADAPNVGTWYDDSIHAPNGEIDVTLPASLPANASSFKLQYKSSDPTAVGDTNAWYDSPWAGSTGAGNTVTADNRNPDDVMLFRMLSTGPGGDTPGNESGPTDPNPGF